jgi:16S rRNA (cytidine1402-2'-O)-methyltransferase
MADRPPCPGTLYVVATPLGHREDLTLRALRVLREASLVACEDTRRTGALLLGHGIPTPTTSYYEHNERWKGEKILEALRSGRDVALVSDAGTPGISDPGFRIVRDARAEGLPVVPVPGPSAAVAALSVSGLPTDRFLFVGFLPPRAGARRRALAELVSGTPTLVFYESPVRVLDSIADMVAVLGDRDAFLCREATKVHEEYVRAPLSALLASLAAREAVRGEIVLVVAGAPAAAPLAGREPVPLYRELAAEVAPGEAVKAARRTGRPPARSGWRRRRSRTAVRPRRANRSSQAPAESARPAEVPMPGSKFLFVSWEGLIADIAWQVTREGHQAKLWIQDEDERGIADGFAAKCDDWRREVDWADVVVFDDVLGMGAWANELRRAGKPVVGGSPYTDKLEDDRAFGQAVRILTDRRATLERGALLLLQKETLTEDDLRDLQGPAAAAKAA